MRVRSALLVACAVVAWSLPVPGHPAVSGDVIVANDGTVGGYVAMSAVDGSGVTAVSCGGDLSHNGTPRYYLRLQNMGRPLPDGTGKHEIFAYDEDCVLGRQLTDDAAQKYSVVRWSPDGHRVAWSGARFDLQTGVAVQRGMWVADVVRDPWGRPLTVLNVRLAVSLPRDYVSFTFAGDGRRVAFSMESAGAWDVHVADLVLGLVTNVTNTPGVSEHDGAISPESDVLAFVKLTQLKGGTRTDVFTMSALGGERTQVTAKSNTSSVQNIHPSFSPDGKSIAFSGYFYGSSTRNILRIATDGSGKAVNLTKDFDHYLAAPQWRR